MDDAIILLAEDRPNLANLFIEALRTAGIENEVVVAGDGVGALDFLFGTGRYAGRDTTRMPSLIVLDMDMSRMDGLETLRRIRGDRRTQLLPVVMLSSTPSPDVIAAAYRLGANSFVDKMSEVLPYSELVPLMVRYWLISNEPPPEP